jgi:hypothetical protein
MTFKTPYRTLVRKLATPLGILGIAVVLMGAGLAASGRAFGTAPHVFTDGGLTLQLSSKMPGVTFVGNTLVCPPVLITTSSGENLAACEFTIASTGSVAPSSLVVAMTVSGVTHAQMSAKKFAIAAAPGRLVPFETTSKTIYLFTGADLPVTVDPGVVWGANAGTVLDNSDVGAAIVVTYTVVAESVGAETAPPVATQTPFESVGAETAGPAQTSTPPPTGTASDSSSRHLTPLLALLICFLLAGLGLAAVGYQRRTGRR